MYTIKEDLIHYIWQTKSFDQSQLKTTRGQHIEILNFGTHNHDAGPDFINARIEIDHILWAGHIEIHLKASDWSRHRHDSDPNYQNVILHVVLEADIDIKLVDNTSIACLELKDHINEKLLARYQFLQNNQSWIPCSPLIQDIDEVIKIAAKDRALIQRLTTKGIALDSEFRYLNDNFNTLIYYRVAWSFGLKVNAEAFLDLAQSISYLILLKHRDNLIQIEALLFGQSGLLELEYKDDYMSYLKREYKILKIKYGLNSMNKIRWKFSKLRPANFPTIRIAQFAKLIYQTNHISELIFANDTKDLNQLLNIRLDGYWNNHYRFGAESIKRNKTLGTTAKTTIIINAIVPILFMYGMSRNSQTHKEKAIRLLEQLPPELNRITNRWKALNMRNINAADSQALIQLKKNNCDKYLCMNCPIGHKIITTDR